MKRKYRVSRPEIDCIEIGLETLGTSDLLVIYDSTDENGEWLEEIWDETEIGLPRRKGEQLMLNGPGYNSPYWLIDVPNIGLGFVVQDASPMGIVFRKIDLENSKLEII